MHKIYTKALATTIDETNYTMKIVMSAEITDRHNEVVDIDSLKFDTYLSTNPVVLPFHEYDKLPVAKTLTMQKTVNTDGIKVLEAEIQFAVEEYEVAKTYFKMYAKGFMNAFSIGFMVGNIDEDAETGVRRLMNCDIIENSCVSVPANFLALVKALGDSVEPFKTHIPKEAMLKMIRESIIEIKSLVTETESELPAQKQVEEDKEEPKEVEPIDVNTQKSLLAKALFEKVIRTLR